jgi:DNA-binding transcriptional LysR family regulator
LVFEHQGRQAIFEDWNLELNIKGRTRLQIPHFMSMPCLVAATDMIGVVPLSLASSLAQQYDLRIIEPPLALASITVKQFWHRRMQKDPGVAWLRGVISDQLVGRDPRKAIWPDLEAGALSTVPA